MLTHEVSLPLPVYPRQMDRALALICPDICDTAHFGGIEIIMCT